jgi:hypothetical protein
MAGNKEYPLGRESAVGRKTPRKEMLLRISVRAPKSAREARALPQTNRRACPGTVQRDDSRHHESHYPLLYFAYLEFGDFDFIGPRSSVAFCDAQSFSIAAVA